MKKYKTTKKDFKLFKKYCCKYQKKLGLINWELHYDHKNLPGLYAQTEGDLEGKVATLRLATSCKLTSKKRKYIKKHIELSAVHEIAEVLLLRYYILAKSRFVTESEINEANHEVIRVIETLILGVHS